MTLAPPPDGRNRRGLLIDYGGVLTTSVLESFAGFERAEGLPPRTVARLLRGDARAAELVAGLETGAATEAAVEDGLAALLGVPPRGLIERMLRGVRLERSMIGAVRVARRSGVRTALVSNSWGDNCYPEELFHDLFDAVVISGQVGLRKPDPAIYHLAAGRVGLAAGECVFVDDLPGNLEPAARIGMSVVHHTDPAATIAELGRILGLSLGAAGAGTGSQASAGSGVAQAR